MSTLPSYDFSTIRQAIAEFSPASRVEPNEQVTLDRVFTPDSHRAVLDLGRQLVVGNRGMGKSLWTHALTDAAIRAQVAKTYGQPALTKTEVVIGFNGSAKLLPVAPTKEAIGAALAGGYSEDDIWRGVVYRAVISLTDKLETPHLGSSLDKLRKSPQLFEETLSATDDFLATTGRTVLILFDALDRLANDWQQIRSLTSSLLKQALGLRSFRSLRMKIFMRPDQYADRSIFQFPDGSKLKNDHVDLSWQADELFGLLFFEICRQDNAKKAFKDLADNTFADPILRIVAQYNRFAPNEQYTPQANNLIVNALAGPYMGSDARRGRVYSWVPLHLSDAKNACAPRTFLTAWQHAAQHLPPPVDRVVDHLGLIAGVQRASSTRLEELREDYHWIDEALNALTGKLVPMEKDELLATWKASQAVQKILNEAKSGKWLAPIELEADEEGPTALLSAMKNIAVMEERANGKINVPDIFRVEAGIKRRGGVAVPRRT